MSSYACRNCSTDTGSPASWTRSRMVCRCGLVNSPVCSPNARSSDSIIRAVEVLPLVPARWITGYASWGSPSSSVRRRIRARSGAMRFSGQRATSSASTVR